MLQWQALMESVKNNIKVDRECGVRMRTGCNWYIEVLEEAQIHPCFRARAVMRISSANLRGHSLFVPTPHSYEFCVRLPLDSSAFPWLVTMTTQLAPWSGLIFHETLVSALLKTFPAVCETQHIVTVFT
jgi:hypothetical protein